MTRTLTGGMQTAIAAQSGEFCHLFKLEMSGGTAYYTDAAHDIDWSGDTYTALGGLVTFDVIQETSDKDAQGVSLSFDGVDTTVISDVLSEGYIGRLATIYRAHLAAAGTITADPVVVFLGYMNSAWEIEEKRTDSGVGYCTVSTRLSSPLARFEQVRGIRADVASHQHAIGDNTDTFMRHIVVFPEAAIDWGTEDR
jgi:hypothetical protein